MTPGALTIAVAAEPALVGRDDELDQLGAFLTDVEVRGSAVTLIGEPGVGKSALQSQLAALARDRGFVVLTAKGSEAETHLPFASLHQLLRPLFPDLDQLSARQRNALLTAFGMTEQVTVEPFLISLGVLELIVESARRSPVLVSLDDTHWMDQPSLDALGFLARRVSGERVVIAASTRPDNTVFDSPSMVQLTVAGLGAADAQRLLDLSSPDLTASSRAEIIAAASGNPLALLEFPVAVRQSLRGSGIGGSDLPMTARLEHAFTGRVRSLAPDTETVLMTAALDDGDDLAEILAAAGIVLGKVVGVDAAQPAIDAGLITVDGPRVRFRHPLVRSAVRHSTPLATGVAVHAALGTLLAAIPDRAVWHRAASATAPDADIAAALEQAAFRCVQRGALQSAVDWLQRAAALSPDEARRGSRLLSAAELAFEMGRFAQVEDLKQSASALQLHPRDRSRLTWLEGVFDDGTPGEATQVRRLVGLARQAIAAADPDLAIQLLVGAARRVWWGDPGAEVRHEVASTAAQIGLPDGDPRLLACLSIAEPMEYGRHVVEQLSRWRPDADGRPELAGLLGLAAFCAGDFGPAVGFLSSPVEALRSQGRLGLLAQALTLRAWSAIYLGSFDVARSADEAIRLADETSQPIWAATARIAAALLAGLHGDQPADQLLAAAGRVAGGSDIPMSSLLAEIQLARGVGDLGAGRYESAYANLRRMFDPREPCFHHVQRFWSLSYLAEAAVHSGRRREGRLLLADIELLIADRPCPTAEIGLFFAHAVLAEDAEAESWYDAALVGPGSERPWHRARIELNYGSWLRRHRRTRDSRPLLRSARQTFDSLGATAWAHRADLELRATGEKGWIPAIGAWDLLSPQESQIAQLAAEGLSNKEISERLFLSHRTVGSHLYRIFPKLNITSRAQLMTALRASADAEYPDD